MDAKKQMNWFQWILFVGYMILKYGPKLLQMFLDIFNDVEKKSLTNAIATNQKPSSEQKRAWFKRKITKLYLSKKMTKPSPALLQDIVDRTWRRVNGPAAIPEDKDAMELDKADVMFCKRRLKLLEFMEHEIA